MTSTIWLCLRCGWRTRADRVNGGDALTLHNADTCDWVLVKRTIDEHGRITGGPRSRQP